MPVAGCGNEWRKVARIVLRGPDPIRRNRDRGQPNPLATRCAVIVEVETRMIGKNRQAASDQHRNKKEVEKVTVAYPNRKTMRTGEIIGEDLRDRQNMREPHKKKLDPGSKHRYRHQHRCSNEDRGPYPNAKAAIRWIMNGCMRRIERNH